MEVFASKTTIYAGYGAVQALKELHSRRLFVVTDPYFMKNHLAESIAQSSGAQEIAYFDRVAPDPGAELVADCLGQMQAFSPDAVVALGGGSAMDCAKAAVYLYKDALTLAAIPTTSGSGSEVTNFAIITANGTKQVLVDEAMQPKMAILDGDLLKKLPPALIADAGFDVLAHALEALVSRNGGAFTAALARESFCTAFSLLERSYAGDTACRLAIHTASAMAGVSFSAAGLGLCHALSHSLGGVFHIPHGRLNAILLPAVVEFNAQAAGDAYALLARQANLGGSVQSIALRNLKNALIRLRLRLNLPQTLWQAGVTPDALAKHRQQVVDATLSDPCCQTNPVPVTRESVLQILNQVAPNG